MAPLPAEFARKGALVIGQKKATIPSAYPLFFVYLLCDLHKILAIQAKFINMRGGEI
jgi:hypothetical protein